MNRAVCRQLAEDRILDAAALLTAGRYSAAYYLAGYAVECGLKACIMAYVEASGIIFTDRKFAEKCWTHDIEVLVDLARLRPLLVATINEDPAFYLKWREVKDWKETSRYEQKTSADAQKLYDAITTTPDGVLSWIRPHW